MNELLVEIIEKLKLEYIDNKNKLYILNSIQLTTDVLKYVSIDNYYNYIVDGINNIYNVTNKNMDKFQLKPESEFGFIEYKLRLDTKTEQGLHKTLHQIKRRLNTARELIGSEEAHYIFGILDKGKFGDLDKDNVLDTYNIFENLIKSKNLKANIFSKH
jgi:hypothetical protein